MTAEPMESREWRSHAACREVDPDIFFPTAEHGRMRAREVAAAKAVCTRCPVRAECLAEAVLRIPYGIAGGLTAEERRGLHESSGGAPAPELLAEAARVENGTRRRAALGRVLLTAGWSTRRVAGHCGVSERTALRWATDLRTSSAAVDVPNRDSKSEHGGLA
jgi:hypothetical protein